MRIALIAARKTTENGELRASLQIAGRTVLEWQAQAAIDLGCERIICLCETPGQLVIQLQSWVEEKDCAFHAVRSNLQLVGLIKAEDDLLMMADGLIFDADCAHRFAGGGARKAIATLPSDHALSREFPEDFERIDRDRNWAGFALISARLAHKLGDLPPDHDAMSLLLRLGLQGGEECRDLKLAPSAAQRWQIASETGALAERESALLDQALPSQSWSGPFEALATSGIRRFGLSNITKGAELSLAGAVFLGFAAIGLAWFGPAPAALFAAGFGVLLASVSRNWAKLRANLWAKGQAVRRSNLTTGMVELISICVTLLIILRAEGPSVLLSLPVFAIGISHLARKGENERLASFWRDRTLHLLVFAVAAGVGRLPEALALFAIGALLDLLLRGARSSAKDLTKPES